jgi:DNA-binding XRE family transcriptional regulator
MEEGYWLVNLRKVRRYREIGQVELADKVGVSVATLALIEQGRRDPKLSIVLKIAEVLGVTIDELTGRKPPEGLLRE